MKTTAVFIASYLIVLIAGCVGTINVEQYPFGSPIHHVNNGIRFLDLGLNDDAFREFASAINDKEKYSPGYAGKGIYWSIVGVPDVAIGYISLSLKYAGDPREELFAHKSSMRVQVTLEEEGWLDEVKNSFSEIEKREGTDAQTYYWMGMALLKTGDTPGAAEHFKKAAESAGRYKRLSEQQLKEIDFK
jgi:tetratricopeptide (TPR) repeat protein